MGGRGPVEFVEGHERQRTRQAQREREVVVGSVFPTSAPDELELVREVEQALPCGIREEMGDSVDQLEAAGGRIGGIEPEQRDHSIDVDE